MRRDARDELLTVDEVAVWLRTSPNALYKKRHRGEGPLSFRQGRRVLYRRAAVEQWIEKQETAADRGGHRRP